MTWKRLDLTIGGFLPRLRHKFPLILGPDTELEVESPGLGRPAGSESVTLAPGESVIVYSAEVTAGIITNAPSLWEFRQDAQLLGVSFEPIGGNSLLENDERFLFRLTNNSGYPVMVRKGYNLGAMWNDLDESSTNTPVSPEPKQPKK